MPVTDNHSPNIRFIPATPKDIPTINSLATEIWRQYYTDIIGADTVEYMLKLMYTPEVIWRDINSGMEYYLILTDTTAIGYFGICPEEKTLFISRIYLKASFRGNKIGSKALEFICNLAQKRNLPRVYLTVAKNNSGSIEFYKHCKFKITKGINKDIGEGFTMDDYLMEREVILQ